MSGAATHTTAASPTTPWGPLVDELRWVIQIRHTLDEEDDGIAVSIFNVPKPLLLSKPECYNPQLIAIGPYHHWRPDLYEMERYKLSAAKRAQKQLPGMKFQQLVDGVAKHERRIRAHYHRYLDFKDETLAWMMAVDACFLLEFLHVYAPAAEVTEGGTRSLSRITSRMSHLVDVTGRKSTHNTILRDIMMLENQIPLFLLRKIFDTQYYPLAPQGDEVLAGMLLGFVKELTPFKMMESFPPVDVSRHSHLLELLYCVLVPRSDDGSADSNDVIEEEAEAADGGVAGGEGLRGDPSHVKQLCSNMWSTASGMNGAAAAPVEYVKKALLSKPVRFMVKVPWKLITTLPGFSMMKQPIEYFFTSAAGATTSTSSGAAKSEDINKPPLVEEITIPSVAELSDVGFRFCPTRGDLTSIAFDPKTVTLYLPAASLDSNSEVVLRNLVAYEASAGSGPLVLTRYTELMNGIIDTEEDVKLLRRSGVVLNHMKSDAEAARVWNGMSRSVRLTKVAFLDEVIEAVNRYYGSRWRVKTKKFMKKYVFGSWPFLTFLAAVLLLLLTGLQAFCSVYSCARWFNYPSVGQPR